MKNINHNTEIDTVALQVDFNSALKQRDVFDQLQSWIINRRLGLLKFDTSTKNKIRVHRLYHGKSLIATLSTGATTIKDTFGKKVIQYYIRIRFAGLKSYDVLADNASINTLVTISAFLNTSKYKYRFVELDVCIDMFCSFKNVLAVCTQKTARSSYYKVGSTYKNTTSYLEYFKDANVRKQAIKRAYFYDKRAKENLLIDITRFEIKLQNGWFLKNNLDVDSILNTLSRYHVMYFDNQQVKDSKIVQYNNYQNITAREIKQLKFEEHRIYPNGNVIRHFIHIVKLAYVDFYGNIKVPPLNSKRK